jgi:hypothetical protein
MQCEIKAALPMSAEVSAEVDPDVVADPEADDPTQEDEEEQEGGDIVEEPAKPGLTQEQIASVTKDIAAVTMQMQEQLLAISKEVMDLKTQMDSGGGLGDIQKELEALKDQASGLDDTMGDTTMGAGTARRRSGGARSTAENGAWNRDKRGIDLSRQFQDRDRLHRQQEREPWQAREEPPKRRGGLFSSWSTTSTFIMMFLVIGPFRKLLFSFLLPTYFPGMFGDNAEVEGEL